MNSFDATPPDRLALARRSKVRRDALRAAGKCINGPMVGFVGKDGVTHGPVVQGGRCQYCHDLKTGAKTPLSVACPQCGARSPHPCRSQNGAGVPTRIHQARRDAAAKEDSK